MAVKLVVVDCSNIIKVKIDHLATVLGKLGDCQVVLQDPAVDGKHCSFMLVEGRTLLTDLKSSDGTFVNNAPIKDAFVYIGDVMRIGGTTSIFLDPTEMTPEEKVAHTRSVEAPAPRPPEETFIGEIVRPTSVRPAVSSDQAADQDLKNKIDLLVQGYLEERLKASAPDDAREARIKELIVSLKQAMVEDIIHALTEEVPQVSPTKRPEKILDLTNSSLKIDLLLEERKRHK